MIAIYIDIPKDKFTVRVELGYKWQEVITKQGLGQDFQNVIDWIERHKLHQEQIVIRSTRKLDVQTSWHRVTTEKIPAEQMPL